MSRIVKAEGPRNAKIVLVGEAPGKEEERTGRPFVGAAGKILDNLLTVAGIPREECYITNVIKERPPNNDFSIYYKDSRGTNPTEELIDARVDVRDEIREVDPYLIVALGNEALKALTGETGIMDFRGSVLHAAIAGKIYKVIPVIHPAMLLRIWEYAAISELDFHKIKYESTFPEIRLKSRDFVVVKDLPTLYHNLKYLGSKEYLSFDIETVNNHVDCVGFAGEDSFAVVVPISKNSQNLWSSEDELIVWQELKNLLENDQKKIAQNASFDMTILYYDAGIEVQNLWMDTMNAFHCVYSELPKNLGFITSLYTDIPYYKNQIKVNRWRYNAMDAMATYEVAMAIEQELKDEGLLEFYHNYINDLIVPYMKTSRIGLRVDLEKRERVAEETERLVAEMEKALSAAVGHEINVMSHKQIKELLYNDIGLPPATNRKTGKTTVDAKALEVYARKHPSLLFDFILSIRTKRKLLSQYLRMPVDDDGRIRTSINIAGTETGRVSSSATVFGTGGNLQNFPKGACRETVLPSEGCVFIQADLSQAEARLVAAFAQESNMQEIFDSGKDFYKVYASLRYDVSYDEVTKSQRTMAKRLVHATNYRMGAKTFADHVGISQSQAKYELEQYFKHFPNLQRWFDKVENELKKQRYHSNPFGRKRRFFGRWSEHLKAEAVNDYPQGTVGDLMHHAFLKLYYGLPQTFSDTTPTPRVVLQVHDSLLVECKDDPIVADAVSKYVVECMTIPINIEGRIVTIPVDVKVGKNWNEVS